MTAKQSGNKRLPAASPPLPVPLLHGVKTYAKGTRIGPACWEHDDLIIVTHGGVEFTVGGRSYACGAGDALIIPPGHLFVGEPNSGGCTIWVQHLRYSSQADRARAGLQTKPLYCRVGAVNSWSKALMQRVRALQLMRWAGGRDDPELPLLIVLLVTALRSVEEATPVTNHAPAAVRVQQVMRWAGSNSGPMPSAATLAARAELSVSHFRAHFRRQAGEGLGRFLRELRLEEGARLLRESNLPIKEIAHRIGYSDPVAFHRAFLKKKGETPARYRDQAPIVY